MLDAEEDTARHNGEGQVPMLDLDLGQLVGASVHHGHVVVGAMTGGDPAAVLQVPVAVVGPHRADAFRDLEVALLHQSCAFLP